MPPGTTGTILLFTVDPDDPEQIYIDDDGSHTYSVGYRIDAHHQPGSPCLSAPDPGSMHFPAPTRVDWTNPGRLGSTW